jgi:hypothetical protein
MFGKQGELGQHIHRKLLQSYEPRQIVPEGLLWVVSLVTLTCRRVRETYIYYLPLRRLEGPL